MRLHQLVLLVAACCHSAFFVRGATLDLNFRETTFTNVGSQVTGIAWAPDGSKRLFASRKGGVIQIVKDGVLLAAPFATVSPLYTGSECGLIGICFDPNFMMNGYVYVFATVSSSEQQIIRYTAVGDVGTNKTVLVAGLPTAGNNHDGGAVGVGPDGKLYWAIGDNGNGSGINTNLTSLASKVGRANLDGSVPLDNPYVDGPGGNNDYIWARGQRNPFTFTFQPDTGALWVNCVGTGYEQVFLVNAGDHAGGDNRENIQPAGYIKPKIKYRTGGTDSRNVVAATGAVRVANVVTFTTTATHGFRQGEKITIAGVADTNFNGTVFVASVPSATTFTAAQAGANATSGGGTAVTLNQGNCISGGSFYDSTGVPTNYQGNFFYGDYGSGRIMRATLGQSNEVLTADYFVTGSSSQIDIAVGPDGALYCAQHGGTIRRLAYTNFPTQHIIVTPTVVRMVEGGETAATICLAKTPVADVTVNIARTSGDPNVTVAQGATLTFTPTNWSVPQAVRLQATTDSDNTNGLAALTVSASGLTSQTVTVHALDIIAAPFTISGSVELQSFGGTNRLVRFILSAVSGGTTNYLQTNDATLTFSNGVAAYDLQAPANTTHISAKTAWNLRQRQTVTFIGGAATVDFTGATSLKGGDLVTVPGGTINSTDNAVSSSDYLLLLGNYLQTVGGDAAIGRADIDGDGIITSSDYLNLLGNYLTGGDAP